MLNCVVSLWQHISCYMVHVSTGLAPTFASDIHRQMPTNMANIRRDWLTNQNTDCCFIVIGLSTRQSHSPLQQLKIDQVPQLGPPYWTDASEYLLTFVASTVFRRIFIYIHACVCVFSPTAVFIFTFTLITWCIVFQCRCLATTLLALFSLKVLTIFSICTRYHWLPI